MVASGSLLALAMVNVLLFTLFRFNSELKPEQASFGAKSGNPKPLKSGMWHKKSGGHKFPWNQICVPSKPFNESEGLVYDLKEAGPRSDGISTVVMSQHGKEFLIRAQGALQNNYYGSNFQDDGVIKWTKEGKKRIMMTWTFDKKTQSCP